MTEYRPRFAADLRDGMLISSSIRGDHRALVTADPVQHVNPVTRSVFVTIQVQVAATGQAVNLIFTPSQMVFSLQRED